jgi:hypothetical protein
VAIDGTVLRASPYEDVTKFEVVAGRIEAEDGASCRFACSKQSPVMLRALVKAALHQAGWGRNTVVDTVSDGALGMRSVITDVVPEVAPRVLDWFHIGMKLKALQGPVSARTWTARPEILVRCERLARRTHGALWRGRANLAVELMRTLAATLEQAVSNLDEFYASSAITAAAATRRLLQFIENNRDDLVDYARARRQRRHISTAAAESFMNHLINRRMSKRQQMRWSIMGAHHLLQARVEMLEGRLEQHFHARFPHLRTPAFAAFQ